MQGGTLGSAFQLITSINQIMVIIPSEEGQDEWQGSTGRREAQAASKVREKVTKYSTRSCKKLVWISVMITEMERNIKFQCLH